MSLEFKGIPIIHAEKHIPHGAYCYSRRSYSAYSHSAIPKYIACRFLSRSKDHPEQLSGYCSYLRHGDWMPGMSMLWDSVKECGIRADTDEHND